MKRLFIVLVLVCLPLSVFAADVTRIRCASTTSTQSSGLFDYLLPLFEKKTGVKVDVVAVGTGAAIEIGKRGDADVIFVHAKEQELKAVEEGYFVDRHDVMYNDFVIVGPQSDKAGIKDTKSATDAFKKIAETKSPFVSRGDNSGLDLEERGHRSKGSGMVPGSRAGNGQDPEDRERKTGVCINGPGHVALSEGHRQTGPHDPARRRSHSL